MWVITYKHVNDARVNVSPGPDGIQAGVLTYNHDTFVEILMKDYRKKSDLQDHISSLEYRPGATNTSGAIAYVSNRFRCHLSDKFLCISLSAYIIVRHFVSNANPERACTNVNQSFIFCLKVHTFIRVHQLRKLSVHVKTDNQYCNRN